MIDKLLALAVLLLAATGVSAQIQIGAVKGAVTDPTGALVTGASVWLTNSITGEKFERVTDGEGSFIFNNVTFNHYTLRAEARGFAPQSRQVTVNSNLPLEISISLSIAGTSEQIVIGAREDLLDPESASSTTTLAANFIGRAPRANRGRQLQELIATAPTQVVSGGASNVAKNNGNWIDIVRRRDDDGANASARRGGGG